LKRFALPAALLATLLTALAPEPSAGSRVLLDRLTWSPDGNHLAVEAALEGQGDPILDTLLVDLSRGGVSMRSPRPLRMAFHERRGLMAVAARYALMLGSSESPESLRVLTALNPARDTVDRVAFASGGDTIFVMSHPPGGAGFDIVATSLADGRQKLVNRVSTQREADSLWSRRLPNREPAAVAAIPFSTVYLPVRGAVFHLERSERGSPAGGTWLYDLHRRVVATGEENVLARAVAIYATVVSPDSGWVAFAGAVSMPRPTTEGISGARSGFRRRMVRFSTRCTARVPAESTRP
jgi:hypothetical protein